MEQVAALGIDVGATLLYLVGLDSANRVALSRVEAPSSFSRVLGELQSGTWVAIDAPDEQQNPRHLSDETLAPKFRPARCAEVALGRRGHWVPWVTPVLGIEAPGWMLTGFRIWQMARVSGMRAIEVYPHAAFRVLSPSNALAKKQSPEGVRQRIELLKAAGLQWQAAMKWTHDFLDAAVAAVVARDARSGTAEQVLCEHTDASQPDGSSIWLPLALEPASPSLTDRPGSRIVRAKRRLPRCDDCPFRSRRVVPGYGPNKSDLVIVGQAPADTEVLEGVPFVGDAGDRLDVALRDAHLDRSKIYITNTVLCQPPDNESPPPDLAIQACHERLLTEVRMRMPQKVLALGVTAAEALTPKRIVIKRERGHDLQPHLMDSRTKVRVTYHPSALNRNPKWLGYLDEDVGWLEEP